MVVAPVPKHVSGSAEVKAIEAPAATLTWQVCTAFVPVSEPSIHTLAISRPCTHLESVKHFDVAKHGLAAP